MTDLEYIVKQAKKFYYVQWDEAELRKCVDMLPKLEHDELVIIGGSIGLVSLQALLLG